jgi:hypothetical protein
MKKITGQQPVTGTYFKAWLVGLYKSRQILSE